MRKGSQQRSITSANPKRNKMAAPIFQERYNATVIEFLRDMRRYIQMENPSFDEMKLILFQSLKEADSALWWLLAKSSINLYEDFDQQFRKRFWLENIADELVDEIEHGIYTSKCLISGVEYTKDLINRSRGLEKYTEAELVKNPAKHHNLEIRYRVKVQDIKDKESLLHLLRSEDEQDKNEKKNTPYYFKETTLL